MGITIHVVQGTADGANIDIPELYDEIDAVNRFLLVQIWNFSYVAHLVL